MGELVRKEEEVAPAEQVLSVPAKVEVCVLAAAYKKLIDALLRRDFLERLFSVDDRQRNKNGAGPRRYLVDIEVAPVGEENNLRRHRRHGIVVVLPKRAKVHFGEGVALH